MLIAMGAIYLLGGALFAIGMSKIMAGQLASMFRSKGRGLLVVFFCWPFLLPAIPFFAMWWLTRLFLHTPKSDRRNRKLG
jgi:hypothetical protein